MPATFYRRRTKIRRLLCPCSQPADEAMKLSLTYALDPGKEEVVSPPAAPPTPDAAKPSADPSAEALPAGKLASESIASIQVPLVEAAQQLGIPTTLLGPTTGETSPLLRKILLGELHDRGGPLTNGQKVEDLLAPANHFDVFGADGAQSKVLAEVLQGGSFTVVGAPGTGKSLTIANLVANLVARGKKVLVVSNSDAGLDVSKKWLDRVGLGDIVANVYGVHATPSEFATTIQRAMHLGRPLEQPREESVRRLERAQRRLNDYVHALQSEVRHSGLSAYEVLSESIALRTAQPNLLDLDTPDMRRWSNTEYALAEALCTQLEKHISAVGSPVTHPFYGAGISAAELKEKSSALQSGIATALQSAGTARAALENSLGRLDLALDVPIPALLEGISILDFLCEYYTEDGQYFAAVDFTHQDFDVRRGTIQETLVAGRQLLLLRRSLDPFFKPAALEAPHLEKLKYLLSLEAGGSLKVKNLTRELALAHELLDSLYLPEKKPKSLSEQLAQLDALLSAQAIGAQISAASPLFRSLFGERWTPTPQGDAAFWRQLDFVASATLRIHDLARAHPWKERLFELAKSPTALYASEQEGLFSTVRSSLQRFVTDRDALLGELRFNADDRARLCAASISHQEILLGKWSTGFPQLANLTEYYDILRGPTFPGKEALVRQAEQWARSGVNLLDSLRTSWLTGLVDDFLTFSPLARQFQTTLQDDYLKEFSTADRQFLQVNASAAAARHWDQIPRLALGGKFAWLKEHTAPGVSDLPSLETFWRTAPVALQRITPVVLTTPHHFSAHLGNSDARFDVVLFDEASQLTPAEAAPALARAGQAVAFGDPYQLPPHAGAATEGEAQPSLLELMSGAGAPTRELTTHYRSEDCALMQLANEAFYEGSLKFFPSPVLHPQTNPIRLSYVGARGTSEAPQSSLAEATRVVALVEEYLRATKGAASLGVVTTTAEQRDLIRTALEGARRENPALAAAFSRSLTEPLFVRTIEEVQGDERDHIIASLVFDGRSADRFGPLSAHHGERRLNVLASRARKTMDVVSSFLPAEVQTSPESPPGELFLRRLLDKAALSFSSSATESAASVSSQSNAPPQAQEEGRKLPDRFLSSIAARLAALGYQVECGVGGPHSAIDLAVRHPDHPDRFILGITTDGPTYQANESARERDLIVPRALRERGWNLHHIWILDWCKDPEGEVGRLQKKIEQLRADTAGRVRDEPIIDGEQRLLRESHTQLATYARAKNPPYIKATLGNIPLTKEAPSPGALRSYAFTVVDIESPIHQDELARRLRNALQLSEAQLPREAIAETISVLERERKITRSDGFLTVEDGRPVLPRNRAKVDRALQNPAIIAPIELDALLLVVLDNCCGISEQGLIAQCAKALGVEKPSVGLCGAIEQRLAALKADERCILTNDGLLIGRSSPRST